MEQVLGPWTGNLFILPGQQLVVATPSGRVHRWSLRIGRDGISWSSISESYGPHGVASVAADRRFGSGLAVAAVAGGLALLLVGATAGRAWSIGPARADAAMIVPAGRPFVAAPVRPTRERRPAVGHAATPVSARSPAADEVDSVAEPAAMMGRAQAIERALRTGEFQEWADRDGVTGFAVPGAAEVGGAGACRSLAVLTRQPDGQDSVSNSRVCSPTSD